MADGTKKKRAKAKRPSLSLRELRFCTHYVEHGNAAQAHRHAFPDKAADSAKVAAFRLLRKPAVGEHIWRLRDEACAVEQITVNRLAQALARIAFADRADLFDEHGCLLPAAEWPADVAGTVEGVETEDLFEVVSEPGEPKRRALRGYNRKVKTARRVEAIKLLMAWRGMIKDAEVEAMDRELARMRELLESVKRGQ